MTGRDVIAQAQSGTGKTATFVITILQQLEVDSRDCQALVLAPTRELAQQVESCGVGLCMWYSETCLKCFGYILMSSTQMLCLIMSLCIASICQLCKNLFTCSIWVSTVQFSNDHHCNNIIIVD